MRRLMTVPEVETWLDVTTTGLNYDLIRYRDRLNHRPAQKRRIADRITIRKTVVETLRQVLRGHNDQVDFQKGAQSAE